MRAYVQSSGPAHCIPPYSGLCSLVRRAVIVLNGADEMKCVSIRRRRPRFPVTVIRFYLTLQIKFEFITGMYIYTYIYFVARYNNICREFFRKTHYFKSLPLSRRRRRRVLNPYI